MRITMAKARRTITALLPGYERNRYRWRRRILANVLRAGSKAGVQYATKDTLEVVVLLHTVCRHLTAAY